MIRSLGYVVLPGIYTLVISDPARRDALMPLALGDVTGDGIDDFADSEVRLSAWEIAVVWVCGYVVVLPVTVWMADLFWRGVDVRCVSLGRWVEERMVMKEGDVGGGAGGGGVVGKGKLKVGKVRGDKEGEKGRD